MRDKEIDGEVLGIIRQSPRTLLEAYIISEFSLNTVDESIKRLVRRKLIRLRSDNQYESVQS